MIPDNVVSSTAIRGGFLDPVKDRRDFLIAYEMGGAGLSDPSAGLRVKLWTLRVVKTDTGQDVVVSAPGVSSTVLFSSMNGITEADLAFDQNMKAAVAYVEAGVSKLWWYDTTSGGYTVITLPTGSSSPRCTLDDKRALETSISDILVAYVLAGNLCLRAQRDRFTVQYTLAAVGAGALLVSMGMNTHQRIQWRLTNVTSPTDDSKYAVSLDPYLGDVILDLCRRAGLAPDMVDVSELYDDVVPGYKIASDDGVATQMGPLKQVFFFDPTEFDRKLHFFKRGRDVVAMVTFNDLVDDGDVSMKQTRVQEDKLPATVHITHLDPAGAYAKNKQTAYRKSNLVKAKAEEKIEFDMVLTADQAADVAVKTLKMEWHELMSYVWALPIGFTALVPADVIDFAAKDGSVQRIRITSRNEDGGILKFEGKQDAGPLTYESNASGNPLPYPQSTTPGLVGETRLELLNLPVLRDQDDELGIYVGISGNSSAWYGAQILLSTDGGVNYFEAFRGALPATMGETETVLEAEVSAEYQDNQTFDVAMNFPLESTTPETLLSNFNRMVVGDEILQFQTATPLGDNRFRLSGLIRARYNTPPEPWPVGTRVVLLDSSVVFLQAQRWMLGLELMLKPVSFGLTEDESVPTAYTFDVAMSQWEWAPTHVTAVRDGADAVTVEWIPRPRLGVETGPYNSKYFTGYKLTWSDGFTVDVGKDITTYTRASTPAGATVTLCGVNSITGDGESTGVIPT